MENSLITQTELTKMSSDEYKNFLTENIHNYYEELIVNNAENKEHVVNLLFKKMENDKRFDKIDNDSKKAIVLTGISCLSDVLKTIDLKQKQSILQKKNKELTDLFLKNYEEKLLNLKEKIKKNQEDFLKLQNNADNMSLGQLANTINNFHNPNEASDVSDQEIDDLLNGGTLEF
ncbi:hypothetical protein [Mangrovimonas xylaniphaga]|uniref:hypothetical protein n=1 Tax=Mangrovimonas xylaniphaga TaxID=1645915 RepID=UPI000AD47C58|nr:hypothetical protein [Mangrovimonas xylaniphaga]